MFAAFCNVIQLSADLHQKYGAGAKLNNLLYVLRGLSDGYKYMAFTYISSNLLNSLLKFTLKQALINGQKSAKSYHSQQPVPYSVVE